MINEYYDIIIVGGGPAGLNAAINCADTDLQVAVFEKDREIGQPIRCAEGTSEKALEKYAFIDEDAICATVNRFRFVAPNKKFVEMESDEMRGFVLDRKRYEQSLAARAAQKGVQIFTRAHVRSVENNEHPSTQVIYGGTKYQVRSKLVIAADGVESKIARDFGIDSSLPMKDAEACYQMKLTNLEIRDDTFQFWFSNKFAPGGYVWFFPKSKDTANVGLGINGKFIEEKSAKQLLEEFIAENIPQATMVNASAGGVAAAPHLDHLVEDNFIVIGDAARMTNALTGGGIASALAAGKYAGETAKQAVINGTTTRNDLIGFEKNWKKNIGKDYKRLYRLKEAMLKFSNDDFNNLANKFEDTAPQDVKISRLFTTILKKKPSLIIDVTKVFAGL